MRSALTSSHLVGRAAELSELELAVREATVGRPALVLLGGDSGVGKTRLVAELEQRLALGEDEAPSPLFLRGEGVEQADGELAYAPLLSALRPIVRARHPALEELRSASRSQLASILPGLEDAPARDLAQPDGQLRLFEALLELIDQLGQTAPLVLALEDMQWADRSTRTFVAFLSHSLRDERAMLLLTYRSDELHRRHPLRPLLSELGRLERTRRIELSPLTRAELYEALTDILGAPPDDPLLTRLFARSEGNPLFTEELLAAGLDGRGAAPQSLRDAFMVRIERLSADAQRAARVVAVGRALDEPVLAQVTGLERGALQAGLREAVSEQVLVADADGHFAFRHALLREALHDDLLPGERAELHLALAREIERLAGESGPKDDESALQWAAEVAGHYAAAGDQPDALRTTVRAADAAGCALAYGEAADFYERALELWPRVPEPEATAGLDHVELLAHAARAHGIEGDRGRAEVLLREGLRELGPTADPARFARLLGLLSRTLWQLNRGEEAVAAGERALAMLPADDPERARPLLRAWLARMAFLRGRFRQAATDGEAALAGAVEAGDLWAESEILNTLGMAKVSLQDVDAGVALLRRAIQLARDADDYDRLGTAYSNLADVLSIAGRTGEAVLTAREGLASEARHQPRNRDWMSLTLSELSFEAGDWATARRQLEDVPATWLIGTLLMFHGMRRAELALGEGDEETARSALAGIQEPVAASDQPQWIGAYGALAAELARRRGELTEARRLAQEGLDRIELCTEDTIRIARLSASAVEIEADIAQRARDLREPAVRRDALARLRGHLERLEAAAAVGGPVAEARLEQACADAARARGRSAARRWDRAAAAWDAIDRPYEVALARWHQAEAEIAAGRRDAAARAGAEALARARTLGARWLVAEIRGLGERGRLDLSPASEGGVDGVGAVGGGGRVGGGGGAGADGAPADGDGAVVDPFGLTARERQVLSLLAQGATNRQIGAALFMAEKTASVHVSRILAKLDVQGRTEAAAVAYRLHLA
ncbi:MAG: AAA family ATPase [Solirubrobacterales bacterium]|nr:AAA family ATPase [Solirubrobacterales bacterium]